MVSQTTVWLKTPCTCILRYMTHVAEHRVRTYELDAYGHVNNANYLHILEYARHEYLKAAGFDFAASVADGYGLFVTRIEIDYKRPAVLDDLLAIESRAVKKGAVSGVMEQTIRCGGDIVARAMLHWAFVDSSGRPCKIPARWDVPGLKPDGGEQS